MSEHEISLDAFQTLIESKLRQPHTSLELPKCLRSTSLSPTVFIQYLQKCFRKMTKPIQLRCIIGILGFEPDMINQYGQHESKEQFEESVKEFLTEKNDEKWVRIMNAIIREKMFDKERDDIFDSNVTGVVDEIIHDVMEASTHAVDFRNKVKVTLAASNDKNEQEIERLLDVFEIGKDLKPYFVPSGYRLCGSSIVQDVYPEMNHSCDFTLNEEAQILKEDELSDISKAEEERRLLEQEERLKAMADERKKKMAAEAVTRYGNNSAFPDSNVGQATASESGTKKTDTASLLMRSRIKTGQSGSEHPSISKNLVGTTASGMRGRGAGLGRGAAANAIGGRALGNPMSRTLGRGGMALSGSSTIRRSDVSGVKGRTAMKNTKMRMIDISEVEGLKKAEEERKNQMNKEDSRESRKRKILENAAAKGLKAKKGWADSTPKDSEKKEEK